MEEWKQALKKSAAQQPKGEQLNDDDVENAFADQAWVQVQNKVKPLTKQPFPLGFEIVWKNDSNSKMIGIYAFRVEKKLIYAPVFFINGTIKGTDLLYNHETKMFTPATNEWADYLISKQKNSTGKGLEKSKYDENAKQMDIENIARMPDIGRQGDYGTKQAFINMCLKSEELQKSANDNTSPILEFLKNEGASAFNKLAETVCDNYDFANALQKVCPEWLDTEIPIKKSANYAETKPRITLHLGQFNPNTPHEKKASHVKKGYTFEDTRPETDMEVVYQSAEQKLSTVTEAGMYNIILKGGENKKLFVSPVKEDDSTEICYKHEQDKHKIVLIDPETKKYNTEFVDYDEIYGEHIESVDLENEIKGIKVVDKPVEKRAYYLFDKVGKWVTGPFYVKDKKTYDGITKLYVTHTFLDDPPSVFILNPDYSKTDYDNNTFNPELVDFIEIKASLDGSYIEYEKDLHLQPGSEVDVTLAAMDLEYKEASIKKKNYDEYEFKVDGKVQEMTRIGAIGTIMKTACVREEVAEEIVNKADNSFSKYSFFSKASKLSLEALDPNFFTTYINEFGVQEADASQSQSLEGNTPDNTEAYQNKTTYKGEDGGDGENSDRLATATPMELFQMSEETGQRAIFEHGVVGQLVKSYDAVDMLEQYMPDLLQALDKIGRSLFLFYWKPEDFQERYGADDQANLENMFVSNFKSFGDLILELLQKNPDSESISTSVDQ